MGIVLAGICGVIYFIHSLSYESTDDAYITGMIVPVSAEVKGKVVKVHISDNQDVTAGAPLVEIDQEDYLHVLNEKSVSISQLQAQNSELKASIEQGETTLAQAHANLKAAIAEENLAAKDVKRYGSLLEQKVVSQSQYDDVQSRWQVARARKDAAAAAVAGAEASLKTLRAGLKIQEYKIKEAEVSRSLAQLDLSRTIVVAPVSGRIAMKNVDPGKYVEPGQPLLSIVKEDTWVVANFKETQLDKMFVGQPVKIKADAYPGRVFKGHVDSMQPGTGSVFSLLPPENATGNFVKVVQRVPIKIVIDSEFDPAHPLWPGLSVVPSVDVSRRTGPGLSGK
ncbi:MAG TPA: HlyD family secretion protein [Deltaproteobacteria bacterium]|nr:HlyD family secretion protein [Deltaproteobacteria bacterium]HPR54571.1 HlyD family secretion protein [Deltaproteobacteria bacterium]